MAHDRHPNQWVRDMTKVADDALVKSLVDDFRSYNPSPRSPLNSPPATVTPVGAGKVVTPGEVEAPQDRSGWRDTPQLKQPDGVGLVDALVMAQDLQDLEARGRQEAARMGIGYGDWLKLMEKDLRDRRERREKAAKDRKETPK
jgi:hypothetical protein